MAVPCSLKILGSLSSCSLISAKVIMIDKVLFSPKKTYLKCLDKEFNSKKGGLIIDGFNLKVLVPKSSYAVTIEHCGNASNSPFDSSLSI